MAVGSLRRSLTSTPAWQLAAAIGVTATLLLAVTGIYFVIRSWLGATAPDARVALADSPGAKGEPADASLEPTITNSIGMKLAQIPAGVFLMGSPESEKGRDACEGQHRERISGPFYLGIYAVTQNEYQQVMGVNPSRFSSSGGYRDKVAGMDTSRFPVEQVSWYDAQKFCSRLSHLEGKSYRLPTEAEWEYACRAGTTTAFNFGDLCDGRAANCNGESPYGTEVKGPYLRRTMPVGLYQPNAFGLYDMHGNVWQWCQDWYGNDDDSRDATSNPAIRGGSWFSPAAGCRAANRRPVSATFSDDDLGFRVVYDPGSDENKAARYARARPPEVSAHSTVKSESQAENSGGGLARAGYSTDRCLFCSAPRTLADRAQYSDRHGFGFCARCGEGLANVRYVADCKRQGVEPPDDAVERAKQFMEFLGTLQSPLVLPAIADFGTGKWDEFWDALTAGR